MWFIKCDTGCCRRALVSIKHLHNPFQQARGVCSWALAVACTGHCCLLFQDVWVEKQTHSRLEIVHLLSFSTPSKCHSTSGLLHGPHSQQLLSLAKTRLESVHTNVLAEKWWCGDPAWSCFDQNLRTAPHLHGHISLCAPGLGSAYVLSVCDASGLVSHCFSFWLLHMYQLPLILIPLKMFLMYLVIALQDNAWTLHSITCPFSNDGLFWFKVF